MGATRPRVWAVPAAPQAGLNNCIPRLPTLCPAERKQAAPAPWTPWKTFDGPAFHGRACLRRALVWLVRLSVTLPSACDPSASLGTSFGGNVPWGR